MTFSAKITSNFIRNALDLYGTVAAPRLSILIYHRVHSETDPLFPYEPDKTRFEAMMRYVASTYRVL